MFVHCTIIHAHTIEKESKNQRRAEEDARCKIRKIRIYDGHKTEPEFATKMIAETE